MSDTPTRSADASASPDLEQQAVPVAQESDWQRLYREMGDAAGALKAAIRPQLDAMPYADHAEVRKAFNHIAVVAGRALDTQAASLPCKSGEGAGNRPEGLDARCGFSAGSVLHSPKPPEWMAACEQLALRYDHWKLTDKATQIRAGHPAWLIEHACVEAIAALTPDATQTREAETLEALKRLVHDVQDLMANSEGVTGLHQNGDVALWGDIDGDGEFSPWLGDALVEAWAVIDRAALSAGSAGQ